MKKILTLLAIAALVLLCSCGEDEPERYIIGGTPPPSCDNCFKVNFYDSHGNNFLNEVSGEGARGAELTYTIDGKTYPISVRYAAQCAGLLGIPYPAPFRVSDSNKIILLDNSTVPTQSDSLPENYQWLQSLEPCILMCGISGSAQYLPYVVELSIKNHTFAIYVDVDRAKGYFSVSVNGEPTEILPSYTLTLPGAVHCIDINVDTE